MTTQELSAVKKIVGLNQTKKAIASGSAKTVFIASDSDGVFAEKIKKLCETSDVAFDESYTMDELGKICKIDVGCAVCCVL